MSPFMANYRRELRIKADIRRKGKVKEAMKFVERMEKVYKEAGTALRKVQEMMKQ